MNYFLDTNIEIGYVFCTDPWNKKSFKLLESDAVFYYSNCVEKEFDRKYNIILKEQKNFLYALKDELKESSSQKLSLKDLKIKSKIAPLRWDFDENKKDRIAEIIWEFSQSKHEYDNALNEQICDVDHLMRYINKFIRSFERKLIERKNNFEREVIFHKRMDEYMDLNERLLFDAGVHYPDNCIILDAHDLSLIKAINIDFISADEKLINKANLVLDFLNISNFHYLKDFC